MPDLVNMEQIGERLGVPHATIRRWRARGWMPDPDQVVSARVLLWAWPTIEAWDAAGRPRPGDEPDDGGDPFEGVALDPRGPEIPLAPEVRQALEGDEWWSA